MAGWHAGTHYYCQPRWGCWHSGRRYCTADGRLRKEQNVPLVEQRWYLTSHLVYFSDTYTSVLGNVGVWGMGKSEKFLWFYTVQS
jgi:hypothetical protein